MTQNKKVILVDIDESLYPFTHTLHEWLLDTHNRQVPWDKLSIEYDLDKYIHDHIELQPHLANGHNTGLDPKPIAEALETMELLHANYTIRACTARNGQDWEAVTEDWISKYFPGIDDIIYTRDKRGDEAVHKKDLAFQHKAHALIDDTSYWVQDLPVFTKGFIVKRPKPLASDPGAREWQSIGIELHGDANRLAQ